jgi:hypothetical protein
MTNEERLPMIGAIRGSTTRPILESMFVKFEVSETQAKIDALKEAMFNPDVFFSKGELELDQQYETLVGAFLSGVWKKMGIEA